MRGHVLNGVCGSTWNRKNQMYGGKLVRTRFGPSALEQSDPRIPMVQRKACAHTPRTERVGTGGRESVIRGGKQAQTRFDGLKGACVSKLDDEFGMYGENYPQSDQTEVGFSVLPYLLIRSACARRIACKILKALVAYNVACVKF